jgi:OFA family oxalate/formate antiporter-like MFS transporter
VATALIKTQGVQGTLMLLGLVYFAIIVNAAQYLRTAPENYAPLGWIPPRQTQACGMETTLRAALHDRRWYLMWLILALNVAAGAALISVAAPLAQELTQVGPELGAMTVCLISLFNGLGRLFWGSLSDRIGRAATFLALFVLQAAAFLAVPSLDHFAAFLVPVAVIALCYGGGFGTMPAFAADVFGAKNAGTIYGAMLTAWSAGAIAGPMLIAAVPYRTALPLIALMLAAAAALPLVFHLFARQPLRPGQPQPVRLKTDMDAGRSGS